MVQVIFHFLWDRRASPSYFKNRIPLKPALGCVCSLANYYEESQSNRVSYFRNFMYSLFLKAILFYFYFFSKHESDKTVAVTSTRPKDEDEYVNVAYSEANGEFINHSVFSLCTISEKNTL